MADNRIAPGRTAQRFSKVKWGLDTAIADFINEAAHLKERENWEAERQADVNIAWYRGHQMLMWSKAAKQLRLKPNPWRRVRLMANILAPLVDGWVAKIGLDKIRFNVRPATDDLEDHDTAEMSRGILRNYQEMLKFNQRVVAPLDKWAILTGESYCKVLWDPGAGGDIPVQDAEMAMLPANVQRQVRKGIQRGDVAVVDVPYFNIFWGPPGLPFDEADWVLEIYDRSIPYVQARYDVDMEAIAAGQKDKLTGRIWRSADTSTFGQRALTDDPEIVRVYVLWARPNPGMNDLTKGFHAVQVGDKIIQKGEIPYQHKRIPIVQVKFSEVSGNPRGHTPVTDVLPLQADINRNISQQAENRELVANPVWMAAAGSIVDLNEWTNRPGGIRFYRGTKPELESGSAMPDQVNTQLAQSVRFAQDLIGLRDVSQAKNPPNVRSGRAILALREADDERLGVFAEARREFFADIGRLMLQTISQYVTEERLIRVMGQEDEGRVRRFTGSMLTGQATGPGTNYFDVIVETAGLSHSPAARMENVAALASQGFLRPEDPRHERVVFEVLGLQNEARYGLDKTRDARETQRRRNEIMLRGGYEPPNLWERHETMLEELQMFMEKILSRAGIEDQTRQRIVPNFVRYESEIIKLMAVRTLRLQMLTKQAMQEFIQKQGAPQQFAGDRVAPQLPIDQPVPGLQMNAPPGLTESMAGG